MKNDSQKLLENGFAVVLAGWLNHNTDVGARRRILCLIEALKMYKTATATAPPRPHLFDDYNNPAVVASRDLEKIIQSCLDFYEIRLLANPTGGGWDFFWVAAPGSVQEKRERQHLASHPPTIMEETVGPETHAVRYVWEALKDGTLDGILLCDNDCGRWTVRRSRKEKQFCGSSCYRLWYASQPRIKAKRAETARNNYIAARTLQQGKPFVPRSYKKDSDNGNKSVD